MPVDKYTYVMECEQTMNKLSHLLDGDFHSLCYTLFIMSAQYAYIMVTSPIMCQYIISHPNIE